MNDLFAIAARFAPGGRILDLRPYGRGNINDTFLVTGGGVSLSAASDSSEKWHFILQRLNLRVFRRPELIMANLATVAEHLQKRLENEPLPAGRRWVVPRVLRAKDGQDHFIDWHGSFWRALSFIDNARTLDILDNIHQAQEVGYALGLFHRLLCDLPPDRLAETLPGFHVTPLYLRHFDEVVAHCHPPFSPEAAWCLKFIEERRALASVLEDAKARGKLRLRPIHGDPKVNNVMLDTATGRAVGMIDLDTVQPGLVHYDLGDCLRSGANPLGEEPPDWQQVRFDPDLGRAILAGYLSQAVDFLSGHDWEFLFEAIRLIPFELGLRFFTDYLEGNVYFKTAHPEHNLRRALVQFRLTESIEAQEGAIRAILKDLRQ